MTEATKRFSLTFHLTNGVAVTSTGDYPAKTPEAVADMLSPALSAQWIETADDDNGSWYLLSNKNIVFVSIAEVD